MEPKYKASYEFKKFMVALKTWIDSGFQQNVDRDDEGNRVRGFQKSDSICFQIDNWTGSDDVLHTVAEELSFLFEGEFSTTDYPFNEINIHGDSYDYNEEVENSSHYGNEKRLAWINKIVASFEE